ncbi:MAG TPA: hypothetical protein VF725_15160, partial [Ktedonobacterales bacterium]
MPSSESVFVRRAATISAWGIIILFALGVGYGTALFTLIGAPLVGTLEMALAFLGYPIGGALIIARRPHNVIGRLLVAIGFGTTFTFFSAAYTQYHVAGVSTFLPAARYIDWLGNVVWPCNLALGLFTLFLFPTGRPLTPRWRWLIWIGATGLLFMALSAAFMPGPFDGETTINPFGVDALAGPLKLFGVISSPLMLFFAVATVCSVVLRFWRSRGDERQMMKWFAFCVALMAI